MKHVIIDLEMCRLNKSQKSSNYNYSQEIIQIGAVVVDESLKITDEFNMYVKPEYGCVDEFIKNLTGITNWQLKDAERLEIVLAKFVDWLPDDSVCVSWSDSDKLQFMHEMKHKKIYIPEFQKYLDEWVDCQKIFDEKVNVKRQLGLTEALIAADIIYDDNIHNGLIDAQNTAKLFIKMEKEPELKLNKYYTLSREDEKPQTFSMGEIFASLNLAIA